MELILINENKLKIMMNDNDMREFGLNENEFYLSASNTRAILSKILMKSNVHTGFENLTSDDKILIQLYPEAHGGCELFITKIPIDDMEFSEEEFFMHQGNERYLLPKSAPQKEAAYRKIPLTYEFLKLEYLIAACKALKKQSFSGESTLYHLSDGKYILFIKQENGVNEQINFLSEFGQLENTENAHLRTLEGGTNIFQRNAVEKISML